MLPYQYLPTTDQLPTIDSISVQPVDKTTITASATLSSGSSQTSTGYGWDRYGYEYYGGVVESTDVVYGFEYSRTGSTEQTFVETTRSNDVIEATLDGLEPGSGYAVRAVAETADDRVTSEWVKVTLAESAIITPTCGQSSVNPMGGGVQTAHTVSLQPSLASTHSIPQTASVTATVGSGGPVFEHLSIDDRSSGGHVQIVIDWIVADSHGQLDTVVTTLTRNGNDVESSAINISGEQAGGSHTIESRGRVDALRVTVSSIDNEATTKTIDLS